MTKKLTLEEIRETSKSMLTPDEVSGVLGCAPQMIRVRARDPELRKTLGFPVMAVGNRVKIPTKAFIRFLDGDEFAVETSIDKLARKLCDEIEKSGQHAEKVLIRLSEMIYDGGIN